MNANLNVISNMFDQLPNNEGGVATLNPLGDNKIAELLNSIFTKYSISKQSAYTPNLFLSEDEVNRVWVHFPGRKFDLDIRVNDEKVGSCSIARYENLYNECNIYCSSNVGKGDYFLSHNKYGCREYYTGPDGRQINLSCEDGVKFINKFWDQGNVTVSSPMTDYGVIAGLASAAFCAYKSYSAYKIYNIPNKAPGTDGFTWQANRAILWGSCAIISLIGTAIQAYNVVSNPQYS